MKARDLKPGDRVLWSEFGHDTLMRILEVVGHSNGHSAIIYKMPEDTTNAIRAMNYTMFDKGCWIFDDKTRQMQVEKKPHKAWLHF